MSTSDRPWSWEAGDVEDRWVGYLIDPTSDVLRNKVNAVTVEELRVAENDLLEARLAELRSEPTLIDRTYNLDHLQAIHRYLFQDVYEWAGELRTVGMNKGEGESFMPPLGIEQPFGHVEQRIRETDLLDNIVDERLPSEIAYLYDYANFAHPFREGNGRAQREFFDQLLAESGHGLDWDLIGQSQLHDACHRARNDDDLDSLVAIFIMILNQDPAY
ncbi:MAG: filamentation induced by cAMP protein Fic [Aeromicrobium sp.]|nr:filamentation induced by cAMP protein Fic [Aeromicrobium sp.]